MSSTSAPSATSATSASRAASAGCTLFSVASEIVRDIVLLVPDAADGGARSARAKMRAIRPFSEASKRARECSVRVVAYVMSLAPVRAVPTSALLARMRDQSFADEVVRAARTARAARRPQELQRPQSALMIRLADLAADRAGARVADALHAKLLASIRGATVNGERMYEDAEDADLEMRTTEIIDRLKRREPFAKPDIQDLQLKKFIQRFLHLPMRERTTHMRTYGPMCLWDVSNTKDFFVRVLRAERARRAVSLRSFLGHIRRNLHDRDV